MIPITSLLVKRSSPLAIIATGTLRIFSSVAGLPAGRNSIPTLSVLYLMATYCVAAGGSASGLAAGHKDGRDNRNPRSHAGELKGLPLRLYAASLHMTEHLPAFALVAALAQTMAADDAGIVGLLGVHVLLKCFV